MSHEISSGSRIPTTCLLQNPTFFLSILIWKYNVYLFHFTSSILQVPIYSYYKYIWTGPGEGEASETRWLHKLSTTTWVGNDRLKATAQSRPSFAYISQWQSSPAYIKCPIAAIPSKRWPITVIPWTRRALSSLRTNFKQHNPSRTHSVWMHDLQ